VQLRFESLFPVSHALIHSQVAGMVAELFEYPFDLAKVRLQAQLLGPPTSTSVTTMRFNGPLDCLLRTWKEEGLRGLYRVFPQIIFCHDNQC
jgi:ornithine carrier protein